MQANPYQLKHFRYSSHDWIVRFLDAAAKPLKILDAGTAEGYLGSILTTRGHRVTGVEGNEELARLARPHYHAFQVVDLEGFDFSYPEKFDRIIFADVLEHLRDPAAVLRRALGSLKQDGEIIVSVPNIANIYIRLSLLIGRFDYGDRGILDRTHLRFFTLRSLLEFLSAANCGVIQVVATPIPVQLIAPCTVRPLFAPLHELHYLLVRARKSLFGYQFVVRAARK